MHYQRWKKHGHWRGATRTGITASTIDLAYIAGLIDGEGWLSIIKRKKRDNFNPRYVPIIGITMCDRGGLDLLVALFSGSLSYKIRKETKWRNTWQWEITSQKAVDVARMLLPFLRIKRAQAKLLLQLYDERDWSRGVRDSFSKAELERRDDLVRQIKFLNQRGKGRPDA